MNQYLIQGSPEWLELRKTKITATDAPVIMGVSPWKNKSDLFCEKTSHDFHPFVNERMIRGTELEPFARTLFSIKTGIDVSPSVVVKDWAMASLDGIDSLGTVIVEIKCPGEKDHAIAVSGKVPAHYYPQIQHQLYVTGVQLAYYFSFDGVDGVLVNVQRDEEYIAKMVEEEKKFYECLVNKTPPESEEPECIFREDYAWTNLALKWRSIQEELKRLQWEEEEIRKQLVFLSGKSNTKGGGISLSQVQRKGNVDYSKIPEIKNVDLEKYRKPTITSWRINSD